MFIYFFIFSCAESSLCVWAFSSCSEWELPLTEVHRLLIAVVSLVVGQRLQARRLVNWHPGVVALRHMDSFWTRDWTCEPALAGRFLSTGPPGESLKSISDITILQNSSFSDVSSIQFSHSVMSDSLQPHGLQHARHPCPSPTPRIYSNSFPLSWWCIQPSHPLSPPSPPALNLSQHQGLFKWVSSSHQVGKVLEFQLQHQSFQEHSGQISFRVDWFDLLAVQGTLKSLLQHHSSKASILWCSVNSLSWVNILVSLFFFW